ncbi:ScbR family autoregulator-binding transcription factor [Streptomyces sp. NPDC087440]|uniref:ScbR family autoregulator-binding transcription factor n=1 Tax=Streptomyces sp. NPDC087440 TaxID=3365790 RepID=UPI00381B5469
MVKQERAVRTRSALIGAAADDFSRMGYAPASLLAISRRAGVTSGALHFHFPTKDALASAVVAAACHRLRGIVERRERRPSRAGGLQLLIDVGHDLVEQLQDDVVLRAGFDLDGDPGCPEDVGDVRRYWHQWVRSTLEGAQRAGELRPDTSVEHVAGALFVCTAGMQLLGRRDVRWVSHSTLSRFWNLLLPRIARDEAGLDVTGAR